MELGAALGFAWGLALYLVKPAALRALPYTEFESQT